MIRRTLLFSIGLLGILSFHAKAQSPDAVMEQANLAYMEESWEDAIELYNRILRMDVQSAPLYHNLGNAWYQKGNTGKAILNYERALLLNPSYEPSRHNLRIARSRIVNPVEEMPLLFYQRWHKALINMMSADGWAVAGIVFLFFTMFLIALFVVSRTIFYRKLIATGAALLFFVSLTAFYSAGRQHYLRHRAEHVIVMEQMKHVNSAPGGRGKDLFVVYEGTKAQVINKIDSWLELRFADGNVGWIASETVEKI